MINRQRVFASSTAIFLAVCALVLLPSGAASAHPLGNFTVNRYDGLVAAPGELRVLHVEDLAEIPATQAEPAIGRQSRESWARERCATAARDSEVTVDGRTVELTVGESSAEVRPGQAGLNTLRVECRWTAPLPDTDQIVGVRYHASVGSGPGWREVTARGDRMTLTESDVPEESVSGQLTDYPEELLSSPEDTASASLRLRRGGPALAEDGAAPGASVLPRGADRWTRALDDLVARQDLTVGFAALALGIAVFLGAMHALAPGHGKTLMAATAAARNRASLRDVLPMAASVTVTHTLGVVALGLLVLAGSAAAPSVIAWLGIASGLLVMVAGASLARRAWRNRLLGHTHGHAHGNGHAHGHEHDHAHEHEHEHEHDHDHDHDHSHDRELVLAHALTKAQPQPRAHTHPVAKGHTHHPHSEAHDHGHQHDDPHEHPHGHRHGHLTHTHGGFTHTHPTAPTLRGTILLGFAGGLVPSPSAVVVLVGAAALGKAWFGLLLVLAYGVGLALTLTAAGFAVVKAGGWAARMLDRRPRWAAGPFAALMHRSVPLVSALVVVALGAGLVFKGAASALG